MVTTSRASRPRDLAEIAALAGAYYIAARIGLSVPFLEGNVTAVWPPTGLALASLLIWGTRLWPGITIGALLVNGVSDVPLVSACGMAVGNTLEAVVGVALLRRYGLFVPSLSRTREVVAVAVLAALVSTAVSASIGVASLLVGDAIPWAAADRTWLMWWIGDALGALIVATFILVWATRPRPTRAAPRLAPEPLVVLAVLIALSSLMFGLEDGQPYLICPVLIWVAVRSGPRGAATANLIVATIAVWFTSRGVGPFARPATTDALVVLDLFLGVTALTSLVLAAVVGERDHAERQLRDTTHYLEDRVVERTIALDEERQRLAEVQGIARLGSWEWDVRADRVSWSDQLYRLYGLEPKQFEATFEGFLDRVHADDRELVERTVAHARATLLPFVMDHRILRPDGDVRWVRGRGQVIVDEHIAVIRMAGTSQDITDEKRVDAALRESEARYRTMVETAQEGIWVTDADEVTTFVNQKMADILGYTTAEMIGRPLLRFLDEEGQLAARANLERRRAGWTGQYENRFLAQDGRDVWALLSASPLYAPDGSYLGALAMVADITERKKVETHLAHQATHDALTGLPNRVLFNDRLAHALARAQRRADGLAVLLLDLDNFKQVNDTLGHDAGDQVLAAVAPQLSAALRPADTIARLGGDEFVVLCEDVGGRDEVRMIAGRLLAAISQPLTVDGVSVRLAASIGVAMAGTTPDAPSLVRHADTAMYTAKERGRARIEFYDPTVATTRAWTAG